MPKLKSSLWIGPAANFICLIHCFGISALSILVPGTGAFITWRLAPYRLAIELSLLLFSALAGHYSLLRQVPQLGVLRALFYLIAAMALSLCLLEQWTYFHLFLLSMGLIQFYALYFLLRSTPRSL